VRPLLGKSIRYLGKGASPTGQASDTDGQGGWPSTGGRARDNGQGRVRASRSAGKGGHRRVASRFSRPKLRCVSDRLCTGSGCLRDGVPAGGDGEDMTCAEPPDPTTPNTGERWSCRRAADAREDHAVLGWLVVDGELMESVRAAAGGADRVGAAHGRGAVSGRAAR